MTNIKGSASLCRSCFIQLILGSVRVFCSLFARILVFLQLPDGDGGEVEVPTAESRLSGVEEVEDY